MNWWVVLLLLWALPITTWAATPERRLSQYAHSAWRIQDGSFSGAPSAITQTTDGYVWIGTSTGLVRFDGVRFTPWVPGDGAALSSSTSVFSLLGGRDGSLWIGTGSNLARLKDGRLVNYTTGLGRINAIVEDREGAIWITRSRIRDGAGPLCRATEDTVRCYGKAEGVPLPNGGPLIAGAEGNLWIGSASGLIRWRAGSSTTYARSELKAAEGLSGVSALAEAADGSLWIGMSRTGPGLGLQQLAQGVWSPVVTPGVDGSLLHVNVLFMDREQTMWIGTEGRGLYRAFNGEVDRFLRADGLSGDSVTGFYQDREGNLWVATSEGIDCFRKTRMISFSVHEGLTANQVGSVLAARNGTIWIGNQGALDSIAARRVSSLRAKDGLPGISVTSLLEDRAGRLWVSVDNGLWVYDHRTFRPITRRDGAPVGVIISMAEDRDGNIWAVAIDNPRRLLRIENFEVREDISAPQIPAPSTVTADPKDGIWLGLDAGDMARYRQGRLETVHFANMQPSPVRQVVVTSAGAALGATGNGLIGWNNGTLRTLTVQSGLPCRMVHGLIFDAHDALWLYTQCGLVKIAPADLQAWWERGETPIKVTVFDALDGVRPAAAPFEPRVSRSSDGRLWFVNETVVQMIDPAQQVQNVIPPPVHIEQIVADRTRHPAAAVVRLPALTRDLQIDYVGLSFVAPQKVFFRYRLDGRDTRWQEAGTRRQAFYGDLRPGTYRFRVIASNNDGLWNQHGDALDIVIAPAWYQTSAFLLLCAATGVFVVWALYQLRMRQVARFFHARFDERLAERTRMARDIHDTLLQTVQGSKMVADHALDRRDDAAGMLRAMEQVSVWLGQASMEGRAAVNALRTSTRETNDLAAGLRRAIEDCGRQGALEASLSVTGSPREMHPVVRDEVYRIGYEAIRNACSHSGGSRLEVALTYARDLTVRVADNGVGMESTVARDGREGHFGLPGIRERAARIGARLTVTSSAGAGTEVTLVVPGRAIFREPAAVSLFERMKAYFTSSRTQKRPPAQS